ncbi:uncharacterized protein LOC128396645 isoform X2 [Panonychus citri]|uniref:uncharacterized protein LOC128396645 isoform X2 n=1 Tax=Panonychus citri TaxID=50023 RepID=UPI0023077AAB|nr:uncharacterized protein LOC128396645 isoform X2 [Panonychus citri]
MFNQQSYLTIITIIINFSLDLTVSLQSSGSKCNRTVDVYETITEPKVTDSNRGQPITCIYTIRIKPERKDWLVFIRFTKFNVGQVNYDRTNCLGGYFQIIDGYRNTSNLQHLNPGFFCGEIDMPKNIISETPYVRIVFHSDSYSEETQFQFSTEIQKQDEHWTKLGQFHKTRNRRGQLITSTYCDRIIQDCSPGHCYIHSPGYPEIYPRNLKCRYLIKSPGGLTKLEIVDMDIDGEQCEGMLICFPRPVTRNYNQCPYDSIKIYDGSTSKDQLITSLCGRGRLSSNIIASQPWMLIEFESSPAGRLVDTGFQIKIETDIIFDSGRSVEVSPDGSCLLQETITDSVDSSIFTNPRSWYPGNVTCSYLFTAPDQLDHLSIEFLSFTIERITLCEENVRIYDGPEPDPFRLMNNLCDTNKPMGGASESVYVTSGPSLLVQFHSSTGSLDGSSINYRFQVKRLIPEIKVSSEFVSQNCSKLFTAISPLTINSFSSLHEQLNSGSFTINPSDFNFPIDGKIHCNLTFDASIISHGRVNVSIISPFNSALTCGKYCDIGILGVNQPKLLVHRAVDSTHFLSPLCFCQPTGREFPFNFQTEFLYKQRGSKLTPEQDEIPLETIQLISNSSLLRININLPSDWGRRPESKPIKINFRFVRESRCGPEEIITYPSQLQGSILFPFQKSKSRQSVSPMVRTVAMTNKMTTVNKRPMVNQSSLGPFGSPLASSSVPIVSQSHDEQSWVSPEWPLFCKWRIHVMHDVDLTFNVKNLALPPDCSNNFLLIKDVPFCGYNQPIQSEYKSSKGLSSSPSSSYHNHHVHHSHQHHHHSSGSDGQQLISNPVNGHPNSIIMRRDEIPSYINGYPITGDQVITDKPIDKIVDIYLSSNVPEVTSFQLYWTQLKMLPDAVDTTELLVSLSADCDFFCKSSRSCLKSSLVCNGFPNCPIKSLNTLDSSISEDESEELCSKPSLLHSLFHL